MKLKKILNCSAILHPKLEGVMLTKNKAIACDGHVFVEVHHDESLDLKNEEVYHLDSIAIKKMALDKKISPEKYTTKTTWPKTPYMDRARLNSLKPKQEMPFTFSINPELFKRVSDAIGKKQLYVTIDLNNVQQSGPIVVTAGNDYALIMPMRLEQSLVDQNVESREKLTQVLVQP